MSVLDYCRHETKKRLLNGETVTWVKNKNRSYCRQAVLSFPFWIKRADFRELKNRKKELELITGVPHSFAHIIPLTHKNVCGLTVPWNIVIQTQFENYSQGNKWSEICYKQLELF